MTTTASDQYVVLAGGVALPLEAIELVLSIERRGVTLSRDGGDLVLHQPANRVTADEREALRRLKGDVLRLIDYCEGRRQ